MRYQVGQKILTAHIAYDHPEPFKWNDPIQRLSWVLPRVLDVLPADTGNYSVPVFEKATIFELEVVKHVTVPGDYDPEAKYDGYILKDQYGNFWTNQYPRAVYGQLDDSGNRLFRRNPFIQVADDGMVIDIEQSKDDWHAFFDKAVEEQMPIQSMHLQSHLSGLYSLEHKQKAEDMAAPKFSSDPPSAPDPKAEKERVNRIKWQNAWRTLAETQLSLLKDALYEFDRRLAIYAVVEQLPSVRIDEAAQPAVMAIIAHAAVPFSTYEDFRAIGPFSDE